MLARVGKPSVALQLKIDQLRGGITEGEVVTILLKDADVVRTKIETEFVTFADGTRVPWSAVKSTKSTISVNELSNALNVINAPPAKQ